MSLNFATTCLNCSMALVFMLLLQPVTAQPSFSEIDRLLDAKKQAMGGKLVAIIYKDGKMIYKKETGEDFKISTAQPIGATSKWLTAALVMTFVDKGELSLDDPVSKYLPIFTSYSKSYITLRQCLAEITGVESVPKKLAKIVQKKKFASLEEEANYYAERKEIVSAPGKEFFYGDVGYVVAGRVLEVVAKKKSFSKLMQDRITKPLAMKKTSFMNENGSEDPSGGCISTADDLARFMAMLLNHGELNGKKILTQQSIDEMEKIQFGALPVKSIPKLTEGFKYGYGLWVQETDKNGKSSVITSPGFNGTWPYLDRCRNYACVIFTKQSGDEQNPRNYLDIKEEIEKQFNSNCN